MTEETARYLRISDDKPGDAHGVANQDTATLELCTRSGWPSDRYADNDISASRGVLRPDYIRMMAGVSEGTVRRIVVFHLSRLWRNRRERAEGIEVLRRHAVAVVCAKGPSLDLSTAYGRGMVSMLGEIDTMESELKTERLELANAARARAGEPAIGGRRAFGYADAVHLDPVEAPLVAELFERWVIGATLGDLCRWLNAAGVTTTMGNAWKTGTMRVLLGNPRYAGLRGVRWREHDAEGRPVIGPNGEQRRVRYHEIMGPAVWPAIVEESVWRASIARLRDPARARHYVGRERKYLLPGLAVCATCDLKLKSAFNNKWQRSGQPSIKCPTTRHVHRYAAPIEEYVVDVVCQRLGATDAVDLLSEGRPGVDLRGLSEEATAIRERLRLLARDEVLGQRTRDEVLEARSAAAGRLSEIDGLVAGAAERDVLAPFVLSGDPRGVWERSETTLAVRRRVVDTLAVVRVGSGRAGRPPAGSRGEPPHNVVVRWRRPVRGQD